MLLKGKEKIKDQLAENFKKTNGIIVTEYHKLTVKDVTELRVELRKANAKFQVVKNRLAKKAIETEVPALNCITESLKGPVGLVYAYGDTAQAAKTTIKFQKSHSETFKIKAGYVEKSGVSAEQLAAIADLPSKEELLAKIIGSIVSPHRGLIGVVGGVSRKLVQVINAIKDKKQV
ncbi:MAG: 50S ribosomal protein L10 [Oligoflexales bacterium]|nr:50S ribosomal protein L10 [Oligoflexales bacterium]